jgi:hypothetical protein
MVRHFQCIASDGTRWSIASTFTWLPRSAKSAGGAGYERHLLYSVMQLTTGAQ